MSSEQIEDVMSALSEMGVNIVENDEREGDGQESAEGEEEETSLDEGEASTTFTPTATKKETLDRTDDPVRMYLREMGAVELLSREGEIAIAKRIEAGRDTMIARSEEHTSELQSLMRISYAVFCLKKKQLLNQCPNEHSTI